MTNKVVIIAMKVVRLIIKVVIWRCSMILRNRLKERRAALDVNQQEMGRLCGVSRQTISLIERGDYSVCHSCINDCKSMRRYCGRSILFTGGR